MDNNDFFVVLVVVCEGLYGDSRIFHGLYAYVYIEHSCIYIACAFKKFRLSSVLYFLLIFSDIMSGLEWQSVADW